jgi:tetratricopeptide (TPR) repeat protein
MLGALSDGNPPAHWLAEVKDGIGLVFALMAEYGKDNQLCIRLLEDAVASYRAALEIRTRHADPVAWAVMQNRLAAALCRLGQLEDGTERLKEAVGAFRGALDVYTRERDQTQWALIQTNLGNALLTLGERDRDGKRLEQAATAFREALSMPTPDENDKERTNRSLLRAEAILRDTLGE